MLPECDLFFKQSCNLFDLFFQEKYSVIALKLHALNFLTSKQIIYLQNLGSQGQRRCRAGRLETWEADMPGGREAGKLESKNILGHFSFKSIGFLTARLSGLLAFELSSH